MLGGISTQGGFMGNAGGLASRYPLGAAGELVGANKQLIDDMKLDKSFALANSVAANPFGGMIGGSQLGNAGGLAMGGVLNDPMIIKKVF